MRALNQWSMCLFKQVIAFWFSSHVLWPDYMSRACPVNRDGVSLPQSRDVYYTHKNQPRNYMSKRASPVSRDPGIAVPGSRLTGLRFFHIIAFAGSTRLIRPIRVHNQPRSAFPWFIASAINRAGSGPFLERPGNFRAR